MLCNIIIMIIRYDNLKMLEVIFNYVSIEIKHKIVNKMLFSQPFCRISKIPSVFYLLLIESI